MRRGRASQSSMLIERLCLRVAALALVQKGQVVERRARRRWPHSRTTAISPAARLRPQARRGLGDPVSLQHGRRRGKGEAAEALSGLARVLFYAGARALLVSHWEVDSDAAVKLVTMAVGAMDKGLAAPRRCAAPCSRRWPTRRGRQIGRPRGTPPCGRHSWWSARARRWLGESLGFSSARNDILGRTTATGASQSVPQRGQLLRRLQQPRQRRFHRVLLVEAGYVEADADGCRSRSAPILDRGR